MWPQKKLDQRTVGILALVRVLMMPAMHRHPAGRGVLEAADAEDREAMLEPRWNHQPTVREQAMVAKIDAERAEHIEPGDGEEHAGPAEEPRQERKQRDQVIEDHRYRVGPLDL